MKHWTVRILVLFFSGSLLLIFYSKGIGDQSAAAAKPEKIKIKPYAWTGPYAEMRTAKRFDHDPGLCVEVQAPWMNEGDKLILRSSEIIGYDTGFFYDDHIPVSEPKGRGSNYTHTPCQFTVEKENEVLLTDCVVADKGRFTIKMTAQEDFVDIELSVRNDLPVPMGSIDWHFCVIGYDSTSIGDEMLMRTYLSDGQNLKTLASLSGIRHQQMFSVNRGDGFIPPNHKENEWSNIEAKSPIVLVESVDGTYVAAIGFERAFSIFSNPNNECFHTNPYFGNNLEPGEERSIRGRLYIMKGTVQQALERFHKEFAQ